MKAQRWDMVSRNIIFNSFIYNEKIVCNSICSLDEIIQNKTFRENVLVNKEKIYDYIVKKTKMNKILVLL